MWQDKMYVVFSSAKLRDVQIKCFSLISQPFQLVKLSMNKAGSLENILV